MWQALDGRKTAIGLVIEALAQLADKVPAIAGAFGGDVVNWAKLAGYAVILLGALHKILKGA